MLRLVKPIVVVSTRPLFLLTLGAACAPAGERRDREAAREPADAEILEPGAASPLCFRADDAILSRMAGAGRQVPGWVRLEGGSGTDSGAGRLVDPGGATLALAWTRTAGDSLSLRGADDLMRFEAQLAVSDSGLRGPARLFSDAQLDRSPSGQLRPAEARWVIDASPALCDSAPVPWTER